MHRFFRPGCLLASTGLLLGASAAQAADYLLDSQRVVASANAKVGEKIASADAIEPAIATAPEHYRTLIAWSADDVATRAGGDEDTLHLVDDEFEIFVRLVNTTNLFDASLPVRISIMGDDFESEAAARQRFTARNPAAVWNPVAQEFLVVWEGDDDTAPLVDDEYEIFGQRVGIDGQPIGERIRISAMGDDTVTDAAVRRQYDARNPSVAVHPTLGHYFVAWEGDHDSAPLVNGEMEIFGRMLDSTATPGAQFRISFVGDDAQADPASRAARAASHPRVINNGGVFHVAWQADDSNFGLANDEYEIFVQRFPSAGLPDEDCTDPLCPVDPAPGAPVRASVMGPDGDPAYDALRPALAGNPETDAVLVAWHGDTTEGALVEGEHEVFARLFDGNLAPLGTQARISVMGSNNETDPAERVRFEAAGVDAAWSEPDQQFLLAWRGDTDTEIEIETDAESEQDPLHLVDDEFEVFGRFLYSDGEPSTPQFRISIQGDDRLINAEDRVLFGAEAPAIAFANGVMMASWSGDSNSATNGFDDRMQVFAARTAVSSTELQMQLRSYRPPTVPEPIRLELTMFNAGETVARNVAVRVRSLIDFPMTIEGCADVTDDVCQLGDIPPGEGMDFSVVLATDHISMGDEQGTVLALATTTDTALREVLKANRELFVAAKLVIEGGSGSIGGFWLLLAGMMAPLLARYRRRR